MLTETKLLEKQKIWIDKKSVEIDNQVTILREKVVSLTINKVETRK